MKFCQFQQDSGKPMSQFSDSEQKESEDSDDEDLVLGDFITAVYAFKSKVTSSYAKGWKSGIKSFTKNLVKLTKGNINTLKQSLFKIGKDVTNPKNQEKN